MSRKQQLLDPINTLAKLILLNFNPDGTKIHIQNNKIDLDPPHKIQSVERFFYGDSRQDICILGNSIHNFIIYYLEPAKNNDLYDKLSVLTLYACAGLKKLQQTYYELNNKIFDNCIYTLQYLVLILINTLENISYAKLAHGALVSLDTPINLLDDTKMKNIWSPDDIDELYKQFIKCFDGYGCALPNTDKNVAKNLSIVESLLTTMENNFMDLIRNTVH